MLHVDTNTLVIQGKIPIYFHVVRHLSWSKESWHKVTTIQKIPADFWTSEDFARIDVNIFFEKKKVRTFFILYFNLILSENLYLKREIFVFLNVCFTSPPWFWDRSRRIIVRWGLESRRAPHDQGPSKYIKLELWY